jgi:HPt (histidine-containing phosphotransfer) domain-containing protein
VADDARRVTRARPPFDPVYLGDIFEAGGAALASEVADTFLTEATRRRAALDAAVAAGDWSGAALAAHAVLSGSSMLGLTVVAEAARQVEYVAREQRPPSKAALLALDGALATARDLLARALATEAARRGMVP